MVLSVRDLWNHRDCKVIRRRRKFTCKEEVLVCQQAADRSRGQPRWPGWAAAPREAGTWTAARWNFSLELGELRKRLMCFHRGTHLGRWNVAKHHVANKKEPTHQKREMAFIMSWCMNSLAWQIAFNLEFELVHSALPALPECDYEMLKWTWNMTNVILLIST